VRETQVRASQVRATQVRLEQVRATQVRATQVRATQVCAYEVCAWFNFVPVHFHKQTLLVGGATLFGPSSGVANIAAGDEAGDGR